MGMTIVRRADPPKKRTYPLRHHKHQLFGEFCFEIFLTCTILLLLHGSDIQQNLKRVNRLECEVNVAEYGELDKARLLWER